MKKAIGAALVAVFLTSGLLVGCIGDIIAGSGNLVTEEMNFSEFTRVEVSSAFEVEITQSDSYSVSVTADDNLFDYIQVSKVGETLKIGLRTVSIRWPATLQANVTMPQLRGLNLSGATSGTASGFSSTENLDVEVSGASSLELAEMSAGDAMLVISGASDVTGDMAAGDVDLNVDGASTVQLEGSANDIVAVASGASRVKLGDFTVNNVDVSLSGASTGTVNMSGRLDADLSGASRLEYIGEPTLGTMNISGASTLSRR